MKQYLACSEYIAFAEHFSSDWIDSWNSHDLPRILSHDVDDQHTRRTGKNTIHGGGLGHQPGLGRMDSFT